jgi:hypothetical protein
VANQSRCRRFSFTSISAGSHLNPLRTTTRLNRPRLPVGGHAVPSPASADRSRGLRARTAPDRRCRSAGLPALRIFSRHPFSGPIRQARTPRLQPMVSASGEFYSDVHAAHFELLPSAGTRLFRSCSEARAAIHDRFIVDRMISRRRRHSALGNVVPGSRSQQPMARVHRPHHAQRSQSIICSDCPRQWIRFFRA